MAVDVGSIKSDIILGLDKYKQGLKEYVSISQKAADKTEETFSRDYTKSLVSSIDRLKNNSIGGLESKLSKLQERLKRTEIGSEHFNKVSASIRKTQLELDKANKSTSSLSSKFSALGSLVGTGTLLALGGAASKTATEFNLSVV